MRGTVIQPSHDDVPGMRPARLVEDDHVAEPGSQAASRAGYARGCEVDEKGVCLTLLMLDKHVIRSRSYIHGSIRLTVDP